jgi:DNA-binding NarL/FixJ family response regulator
MTKLRILVADDHEVIRQGVISLIKSQPGWEVCAQVANGRDAIDRAKELRPDVVTLDVGMPILNGIEATRQITKDNPCAKVLILTMADGDRVVHEALEAGARGFVLKSDASRDLIAAIDAVGRGNTFFTARVSQTVLLGYLEYAHGGKGMDALSNLSPREREVIQLLAEGHSSKQVASRLGISSKTAETHRSNMMQKLNLHSLPELVVFAVRNGIIQVPIRGAESAIQRQTSQMHAV